MDSAGLLAQQCERQYVFHWCAGKECGASKFVGTFTTNVRSLPRSEEALLVESQPSIAIIGSGPAGCYTAQFLRKEWPNSEICVFEALPVPYGLLRYGVAADHQGTKAVAAQFDRLFERENVRFAGNVSIGKNLPFEALATNFDIVILATGLSSDRALTAEVDPNSRVLGAGSILKALNGYPEIDLPLLANGALAPLGERLAVVGNGNVAMDVIRILSKPIHNFQGSDIDDKRLSELRADRIRSIEVFGRSSVSSAKFDLSMLKEILHLPSVTVAVSGMREALEDCPRYRLLCQHLDVNSAAAPDDGVLDSRIRVTFHFEADPLSVGKNGNASLLTVRRQTQELPSEFEVDSIVTATGFTNALPDTAASDMDHWVGKNVFRTGWLSRNGKGTVAENRREAKAVAEAIVLQFKAGNLSFGAEGFPAIETTIEPYVVDFRGWKNIDCHELKTANADRCRKKITDIQRMLSIAAPGKFTHQAAATFNISRAI